MKTLDEPTTLEQAIGVVLRKLRTEHKLTLDVASKRSGISLGYLSQIEIGLNDPSLRTVKSLAASYGVLMSDLIGRAERLIQPNRDAAAESMARELEM